MLRACEVTSSFVLLVITCLASYIWKVAYNHIRSDLGNADASEEHVRHDNEEEYK